MVMIICIIWPTKVTMLAGLNIYTRPSVGIWGYERMYYLLSDLAIKLIEIGIGILTHFHQFCRSILLVEKSQSSHNAN